MDVLVTILPVVLIVGVIGLPCLWWSLGYIYSLVVDPIKEKRLLIEKKENNQIEKYKKLCREIEKDKKEVERDKQEVREGKQKLLEDREAFELEKKQIREQIIEAAERDAEQIRNAAKQDAAETARKMVIYSAGLQQQLTASAKEIRSTFQKQYNLPNFFDRTTTKRLCTALSSDMSIQKLTMAADIRSGDHIHKNVTLEYCPCDDFDLNGGPCKHILFFAYSLGVLQNAPQEYTARLNLTVRHFLEMKDEYLTLDTQVTRLKKRKKDLDEKIRAHEKAIKSLESQIDLLIQKRCEGYPQLAGVMADLHTLVYKQSAQALLKKARPAEKEAARIKELQKETNRVFAENKILEYKLAYIHQLFPDINDIFEDGFEPSPSFELKINLVKGETK